MLYIVNMNRVSLIIALALGTSLGLYFGQKNWLTGSGFDSVLAVIVIVSGTTGVSNLIAMLTKLSDPLAARLKKIAAFLIITSIIFLIANIGITVTNHQVAKKGANEVVELLESNRISNGNYPEFLDESIDHPAVFHLIYDRKEATDSYKLGYLFKTSVIFGNETFLQLYDRSTQAWEKTSNDLAVFE